jgi:hypothetical protein
MCLNILNIYDILERGSIIGFLSRQPLSFIPFYYCNNLPFNQNLNFMKNSEIKAKLIGVLSQVKNKGKDGDTGYTANEVMRLTDQAIQLIQQYSSATDEEEQLKNRALQNLTIAYKIASSYFEPRHGFDTKIFRNSKVVPSMYVNKTYNALDYFIHQASE